MGLSSQSAVSVRRPAADIRPRALELFAKKVQSKISRGKPFECLITGDAEMRRLNREYRGKDYTTDVLSFPAGPGPSGAASALLGEIVISAAQARRQAREYGHTTQDELRILLLHGALHLAGFDHETDTGRMAAAEKRWRARFGLPGGLIERAHA